MRVPADREACITGLGAVSAFGDVAALWEAALAGRTAVRALDAPWLQGRDFKSRIGAPVPEADLTQWGYTDRDVRWLDRVSRYALGAAAAALRDAGFDVRRKEGKSTNFEVGGLDATRTCVVVGSGVGGLGALEAGHEHYVKTGTATGAGPLRQALIACIPNAPAAQIAIAHGFEGECKSVSTACAAGTMAIGDACRLIWSGGADVVVAGGTEVVLSDHDGLGLMAFDALRCLSTNNDDPAHASRPFDRRRDGFVLGEGAGVVIIESRAHAQARGAKVLARVLSYASRCQALSMVQPDATGEKPARVMADALRLADVAPRDVGACFAHATSTPAGDASESRALRRVFGDSAQDVLMVGLKGATGHGIAASGAIETIASVLALQQGVVPPTAGLEEVDPECELRHVIARPAQLERRLVLKSSFGFGGHDAAILIG